MLQKGCHQGFWKGEGKRVTGLQNPEKKTGKGGGGKKRKRKNVRRLSNNEWSALRRFCGVIKQLEQRNWWVGNGRKVQGVEADNVVLSWQVTVPWTTDVGGGEVCRKKGPTCLVGGHQKEREDEPTPPYEVKGWVAGERKGKKGIMTNPRGVWALNKGNLRTL